MTAPSTYTLVYPVPCEVEGGCGTSECATPEFNAREQIFCQDVTINANLTVQGNVSVVPAQITVGGLVFKPTLIETNDGIHLVLAVY